MVKNCMRFDNLRPIVRNLKGLELAVLALIQLACTTSLMLYSD